MGVERRSTWALLNLARTLNTKFETDWRRIPDHDRRAWGRWILAGVVSVMVALIALLLTLDAVSAGANHFAWEEAALRALEKGPVGFGTAVWMQTFGSDFMLVFVVLTTAGLAIWHDRPLLALSILLTLVLMDAVVRVGWFALERHRPDIIAQGLASPGFHSFPSGHTTKTVAVYGLLAAHWFKASRNLVERFLVVLIGAAITLIVPFARLRMGVHWPTDVAGGYVLGLIWLAFVLRALRRASAVAR